MTLSGLRDLRPREIFFIELSIIGSAILVASFVVKSVIRYRKFSKFPLINGRRPFEFTSTQAKKRFSGNAKELIHSGFVKVCAFIKIVVEIIILLTRTTYLK
jgi:hypothetical protein